jgi:TolB-like protein/class 3 adenylate cyclase/Tfp pilus assembly protein PilF
MPPERRLAAIMFTDIVGYTALMAESEEKGLRVRARHRELVRPLVERYHGEWIESPGDQTLSTFLTALDAVDCGLAVLARLEGDAELRLHIGVHLGDLVVAEGEITGDGVNIAARLCPLSKGSDLCVSGEVYRSVRNQPGIEATALGEQKLKNVPEPVAVYSLTGTAAAPSPVAKPVHVSRGRGSLRADLAVAALVVIAIGAGWWLYRPAPTLSPIRSIAVLPLENLSGDPEQEYFADGMTNEIISEFAKLRSLRIPSWTTVRIFKDTVRPLPEIADILEVEAVVEGTVLRAGDRVRITLQLIDARNDSHLWAESYERDQRDVLALQGEIARTVADRVEAELTPGEASRLLTARIVNPRAHEALLRGRLHLSKTSVSDSLTAIEYFLEAIELDPNYAPAYADMAQAYTELAYGHGYMRPHEAIPEARAAAERAIELDNSLGSAHTVMGLVLGPYGWQWERAEAEFRRGAELSPGDARVVDLLGIYLSTLGRHDEALAILERAVQLGSLELVIRSDYALGFLLARDYERAREEAEGVLAIDPDFAWAHWTVAWSWELLGRAEDAHAAWTELFRRTRSEEWLRGWTTALNGSDPAESWRWFLDAERRRSRSEYVATDSLAALAAFVGDLDYAIAMLDRAYDERPLTLAMYLSGPWFDPLRSDPRFQDLLRRIGYPEG